MHISSAAYIQSSPDLAGCPKTDKPEFAFIGRSNVGKSSLINLITGRNKLALTSGKPGKTKSINHFLINDAWYLVDLPGYGFAQISQEQREKWIRNTEEYLLKRESLQNVFLLIDSNVPPQKKDLAFADWMGSHRIPFSIVFTKADRAKPAELSRNTTLFKNEMLKSWDELPPVFITSAEKKAGGEDILKYIQNCLAAQ